MKKTVLIVYSILIVGFALQFSGCSKENQSTSVSEPSIFVKDGRLVFKDLDSYLNHAMWILENQTNRESIANMNKSLGFKSMGEYYFEGMKMIDRKEEFLEYVSRFPNVFHEVEFDNSIIYVPESRMDVLHIINKDGIVQVGNRIVRFTYAKNLELAHGDESKIGLLLLAKDDDISTNEVFVKKSFIENESKDQYAYNTAYFSDDKYRIVGRLWEYNDYFTGSYRIDIETNAQKKTLGVWFGASLTTRSENSAGYYRSCSDCTLYSINSDYQQDTGTTRYTFVWREPGYSADFDYSYCPVAHHGWFRDEKISILRSDAI